MKMESKSKLDKTWRETEEGGTVNNRKQMSENERGTQNSQITLRSFMDIMLRSGYANRTSYSNQYKQEKQNLKVDRNITVWFPNKRGKES